MTTLIRAEITKLRTLRSTWIVLAVCAVLTPAVAALILGTHKHHEDALSQISSGTFALSALIAGILSATALANEYKDRTIATTFALVPDRRRVVLAKATAALITGALLALLATAACYGLAAPWLHTPRTSDGRGLADSCFMRPPGTLGSASRRHRPR